MKRVARLALQALILATGMAGCGTWYSGLELSRREAGASYEEALAKHSLRGWRTRGLEEMVSVTATLQTEAFLAARLAEQERLGLPPPPVLSEEDVEPVSERGTSAVIFVQAPDPAWERLDGRDAAWTVFLESGGRRYQPLEIQALDGRDATIQHLFPFVTRFGRVWLVSFDVEEMSLLEPTLVVTGALARFQLVFDLDRRS